MKTPKNKFSRLFTITATPEKWTPSELPVADAVYPRKSMEELIAMRDAKASHSETL